MSVAEKPFLIRCASPAASASYALSAEVDVHERVKYARIAQRDHRAGLVCAVGHGSVPQSRSTILFCEIIQGYIHGQAGYGQGEGQFGKEGVAVSMWGCLVSRPRRHGVNVVESPSNFIAHSRSHNLHDKWVCDKTMIDKRHA